MLSHVYSLSPPTHTRARARTHTLMHTRTANVKYQKRKWTGGIQTPNSSKAKGKHPSGLEFGN